MGKNKITDHHVNTATGGLGKQTTNFLSSKYWKEMSHYIPLEKTLFVPFNFANLLYDYLGSESQSS